MKDPTEEYHLVEYIVKTVTFSFNLFSCSNQDRCWIAYLLKSDSSKRLMFSPVRFDDDHYDPYLPCNDGDHIYISDGKYTNKHKN